MLQKLDDSSKLLAQQLDRVEQKLFTSTLLRHHTINLQGEDLQTSPQAEHAHQDITHGHHTQLTGTPAACYGSSWSHLLGTARTGDESRCYLMVDNLRRIPTVAKAVHDVLASYEAWARADSIQGKTVKQSRRYNSVDTVSTPAHLRWPNAELTMPQWVAGQLTNIYNISDLSIVKQTLLEVIQSISDATSLPWAAVRNAWALRCMRWRRTPWHGAMPPNGQ